MKNKKQAPVKLNRWSFEPSAETLQAFDEFIKSMGDHGMYVNKSKLINALVLDGLRRETKGNKDGIRS